MLEKLCDIALGREIELRERMFRVILLAGGAMSLAGIIECMIVMDVKLILLPLLALLLVMGISLYTAFRRRKMKIAAVAIGIGIIAGVFPCMFFLSGGIEGGATVWFVLALFYVFMMFSGKKFAFFFGLAIIADIATYVTGYLHPEWITPMESELAAYVDSFFSVMAVGLAVGIILKFQMKIFEIERSVTNSQKEELQRISDSKNEFFANMSHEIRTPINTIIGLDEMILRENPGGAVSEYAQDIKVASRMLLDLVNDILDLSQMEIKRMEIVPAAYETKTMFTEVIEMLQASMQEKKLEFAVDIDGNLPSALYGDEKRIKQILLNILSNAVKYTKEGSVIFSVRSEETAEGNARLTMSVEDTGIGIRREDFDALYDPFKRIDAKNTGSVQGSGLGLAITKQLVEMMGGKITVDSIYTKGSTFTVTLEQPIVEKQPIGKFSLSNRKHDRSGEAYQQSFEAPEARVLVVEDNEMNAMVLQRLLAPTKMQIDIANGGKECLAKTKQKYYNIILMDYTMPGMSGTETLEKVRRQENGLCRESAVVILTASIIKDARQLCREYGFNGYLEKPIQPKLLEAELLRLLPEDIVEYRLDEPETGTYENQVEQIAQKRKKKIYITSDCVCDLPEELLEKYDIRLMYLYIETANGRFADTVEIDADNLSLYLTQDEGAVRPCSVSVEEYEKFFAEALTHAEQVVHVSMAAFAGETYKTAVAAARGFGHVNVVDSGLISGGEGLMVLYAAKMAKEGCSADEIAANIECVKRRIESRFLVPEGRTPYMDGLMSGAANTVVTKLCDALHLHSEYEMRQSCMCLAGVRAGRLENAWKRFLRAQLKHRHRINADVVIITHVGCTVKQQEILRREVLKCVPFKKVIIQRASFSVSSSAGIGAIGIAFYSESKKGYAYRE